MQLAGFSLLDVIHSVGDTVVATAQTQQGERVVLKVLDHTQPSPEMVARWRHEFSVLQSIDSDWIVKARALQVVDRQVVLVLEDFGSHNLAYLIEHQMLDLAERLNLAIQLSHALSAVHQARLIHGDIAPKNVLVDLARLRLKLCDFGLSSQLDHEQRRESDAFLRGTLAYMAPEQTGRTNLDVDYRSDFYSLGVTLYELFGGRKPFHSGDAMAMLHAHLALPPQPLHELNPAVPEALSAIVHKLLAKFPDDRYQSSFGLRHDLQTCAEGLQRQGSVAPFALASADVPERFCIAQKLYGREMETQAVLAAFERVAAGRAELMVISGRSGIGKSALVSELHRPVVARRGYFLRGKCDQYNRQQPYAALVQAFQPLMQQLAVEGDERRHYWRERLGHALGEQAGAVAAIIPTLPLLIGSPPPLPALPAAETEQRFHIAFTRFVQALAARNHPLMVFLDDLQWADAPTLKLLQHIVADEAGRAVLIVGAFRDNELTDTHPLTLSLQAIEHAQGHLVNLQLAHLAPQQVAELVGDTLLRHGPQLAPLTALCIEKTAGNPFFLSQFLRSLVAQGDVRYDRAQGAWQWDIERIRQRGMTDNVVTLMLERLRTMPAATQRMLPLAAHMGDAFSLSELMVLMAVDAPTAAEHLWPALQAGLVLPLDDVYKFKQSPEHLPPARFRFLHDRVQQAAHDLVPADERQALQLHCGRRLRDALKGETLEAHLGDKRLFVLLDCLNAASALINDPAERRELLGLNLHAGLLAKSSSAYGAAVNLLRHAKAHLAPDGWTQEPETALTLVRELAEAEYLVGHFDAAQALYAEGLAACQDPLGQVSLWLVQADQLHIQGRFAQAFPVLLQALARLGCPFPASDEQASAAFPDEFTQTEALLATQPLQALTQAPEMRDPARLAELRLYHALSYASYQTGQFGAFVVAACRMVRTTLQHGQGDLSCVAYVAYMTAMSAMRKPYPDCYAMGRLALTLAEQRDNRYFRLTVYQYFGPFYQHWCEPLANTLPLLERGLEMGQSGINPLSAGYCALLRSVNRLSLGTQLDELTLECEQGLKFLQSSHQTATEAMLQHGVLQPVLALRGRTLSPLSFDTATCTPSTFFAEAPPPSILWALHSSARLRHAYLMDDAWQWRRHASQLSVVGMCLPDSPTLVDTHFYTALGLLREGYPEQPDPVAAAQATHDLFQTWADACEPNFRHKQLLIGAELARVRGDQSAAMELYARAIDTAASAGFTAAEALANELYAHFWRGRSQKQLAANFIREANYLYRRWGAVAKCRQLEQQWSHVTFRLSHQRLSSSRGTVAGAASWSAPGASSTTLRTSSEGPDMLDLQSMLKAQQTMAQEIHLDQLLAQMLAVMVENAGADFGAIVRADNDELFLEALGVAGNALHPSQQRLHQRLAQCGDLLPTALIEFTKLVGTPLVLSHPAQDERFARSAYWARRQPKSALCLPVQAQGQLVALVYLENNQFEGAFTTRHQRTLAMLSTQAAISLVNARLYESLEEKVAQRTEELRLMSMKDGLTGIANRRAFDERLALEWRRSERDAQPLSLLMMDIDHFKAFNDHRGHVEGDHCIQAVAQVLADTASRITDLVARYGGEEFAVLMPHTDDAAAAQVAQACLAALAQQAIPHGHSPVGPVVSISIGSCTLQAEPGTRPEALILRADAALYRAKREGRNRYCSSEDGKLG